MVYKGTAHGASIWLDMSFIRRTTLIVIFTLVKVATRTPSLVISASRLSQRPGASQASSTAQNARESKSRAGSKTSHIRTMGTLFVSCLVLNEAIYLIHICRIQDWTQPREENIKLVSREGESIFSCVDSRLIYFRMVFLVL